MKRLSYEEVKSLTNWEVFEVAEKLNDSWNRRGE